MTRKWNRFKAWLRDLLFSEDEDEVQDGPRRPAGTGGFFNQAHDFALNNPNMTAVHGNQYNFSSTEGDRKLVTQMMGLLSQHIIRGAEHDSSARDPPPRCHPETRLKLIARITAWFEGQASLELLLWITGPAGVGKSAVVQTFAEYLFESQLLGASVFISRPNKRDNPQGVFITIAYQLTTRIRPYRDYIVERLSSDPELPRRGIRAQFMAFIIEPFVEKRISAGGKRWGILIDGLDELQGEDPQCEIIQLISSFVHEHPNAPLVWIIASRPESRISHAFEDEERHSNCLVEKIPIDSTEACEDVERFLRSSFKTTQKNFRHSIFSDWPSNNDFLKLTAAASGLFIYAEVAMQFIGDSHHGDPVARFEALISVVDRSNAIPSHENPFVHLDALYKEILSSIPSTLWPTTKRLLGLTVYRVFHYSGGSRKNPNLLPVRGMCILLGITPNTVYASLDKSRSTLKIPVWKVAHQKPLTFLHASFSDYLKDSKRSGDFHVGSEKDVKQEMMLRLMEIWSKCSGDGISRSSVVLAWHRYCSELTDKSSSMAIEKFYTNLFHATILNLLNAAYDISCNPKESPAYMSLRKLAIRKLFHIFISQDLEFFVDIMMRISPEPRHIGFLRKVQLKDLEFGHFDWNEMSPAYAYHGKKGKSFEKTRMIHRPRSSAELTTFVSELESLQERSPELRVVILGGVPQERVAVFQRPLKEKSDYSADYIYYAIPYPE